ncbi:hypothetical protein V2J09_008137 [Rumex salicifolius]
MISLYYFSLVLVFIFVPTGSSQSLFVKTANQGEWRVLHDSIGISAMHMQLLHNNKIVMYDRTDFGRSNISLPDGRCRRDPFDPVLQVDCTAHSVLYDVASNTFRPLMVESDTWCSSGSVLPDGILLQSGGFNDGDHVVRTFTTCADDTCDWVEHPNYLYQRRWYSTNQILPDGRVIIVGGRRQFNYEFYPRMSSTFALEFLAQTSDESENNLYPFVHLLPDGNLFIFANTRAISFDYNRNQVVREFPPIPFDVPRNYPSSGSSVMLPIDENQSVVQVEILVCGGAPRGSYQQAANRVFMRASDSCGRIRVTDQNPSWVMETMPIARVMGDMLLLPNGDVIIINGAESGTAGWERADSPVLRPVIYRPVNVDQRRFAVMEPGTRPRMYHSSAVLLPDGRVLVGGSNPHIFYNFSNVQFPTDLSLEAFSPPYLSVEYAPIRPSIVYGEQAMGYMGRFSVTFRVQEFLSPDVVSVNLVAPSFTTHAFAMNQRMVVLGMEAVSEVSMGMFNVRVVGPTTRETAPPGYYLLFVVHAGVPSAGMWVRVQ